MVKGRPRGPTQKDGGDEVADRGWLERLTGLARW